MLKPSAYILSLLYWVQFTLINRRIPQNLDLQGQTQPTNHIKYTKTIRLSGKSFFNMKQPKDSRSPTQNSVRPILGNGSEPKSPQKRKVLEKGPSLIYHSTMEAFGITQDKFKPFSPQFLNLSSCENALGSLKFVTKGRCFRSAQSPGMYSIFRTSNTPEWVFLFTWAFICQIQVN